MTLQTPRPPALPASDAGRQIASLREALILVRSIAGDPGGATPEAVLDEAARFSGAYERASPVLQRRFDAAAAEVSAWAAAGVEALLAAGADPPPAPARRLASALDEALDRLAALLGV